MGSAIILDGREHALGNTGWQTPAAVFGALDAEFGPFDLEPAGAHEAVASLGCAFYCTPTGTYDTAGVLVDDTNGLERNWVGKIFVNPPYRRVEEWVRKGSESAATGYATVVMLLIPSTDSRWFHRYVWDSVMHRPRERVEVRFLQGRIRFIHPDRRSVRRTSRAFGR